MSRKLAAYVSARANGTAIRDGKLWNGRQIKEALASWASSPMGSSATKLQNLADSATWLEGQRFSGGAAVTDVQSWVDSLNLNG